jgi:hypothetical protein
VHGERREPLFVVDEIAVEQELAESDRLESGNVLYARMHKPLQSRDIT